MKSIHSGRGWPMSWVNCGIGPESGVAAAPLMRLLPCFVIDQRVAVATNTQGGHTARNMYPLDAPPSNLVACCGASRGKQGGRGERGGKRGERGEQPENARKPL